MKYLYIISITLFFLGSCSNEFDEDLNRDPNNPNEASASQLIANAAISLQNVSHNLSGQFLAQYLAEVEYQDASLYPVASTSFYGFYQGPLMNLQTVLDNSMGSENQQAVAKILKAFYFWHITDRWGDVPYTEALQGENNLTPAYDTQEFIYNSLFDLLEEANQQINTGSSIPDDIIYNGNMAKWQRLANSIRLLMALRLSEVDPQKGQQEFNDALNDGVMTSNDDNFIFEHLENALHQSFWFQQIDPAGGRGREWWALSENLVETMASVDDPRLSVFARHNADDEFAGLAFGTEGDIDSRTVSLLGAALWEQDAPVYLVTYAQIEFALAEAAHRGWIPGGDAVAEQHYNEAIEASFLQWTGTTAGLQEYLAEPEVAYDPGNAIERIANQRYIHLFMNGYEAWAEWRRTGYPDDLVAPGGRQVPRRQIYTETEQFNNAANYEAAVQRQFGGDDTLYGRVWWDVP